MHRLMTFSTHAVSAAFLTHVLVACSSAPSPVVHPEAKAREADLRPSGAADPRTTSIRPTDGGAGPEAQATPPDAGNARPPRPIVKLAPGLIALQHVTLFDGTLGPPKHDQTIILDHGKVKSIGASRALEADAGTTVLDLTGRSVLPGLVGMHDHLYYVARARFRDDRRTPLLPEILRSAPRLYLFGGVTTIRTTGSVEPYADLNLRRMIDEGASPGPDIDVTAPYLEGPGGNFPQMPVVRTPEDARRFVDYWADQGASSLKAYTHVSRAVLRAAIDQAHRRGLKVTGHLCSITYAEAADLGIDNLEHGFFVSTDFVPGKKVDECPDTDTSPVLTFDPESNDVRDLIKSLVARGVAITSTLPVFEDLLPGRAPNPLAIDLLEPVLQARYRASRRATDAEPYPAGLAAFKAELRLERDFVAAGGVLLAGPDPTGMGGVLPGFGDQREIELLVEAGFTATEAIHIGTSNGATFLGRIDRIGTVAPGKVADLVVVRGDPEMRIADIENVEWVFKHGVGYDPEALIESVRGTVGLY